MNYDKSFKDLITDINARCKIVNIDTDPKTIEENTESMTVKLPCNKSTRDIVLVKKSVFAHYLSETKFEKYQFIDGYQAIYSSEENCIEAILDVVTSSPFDEFTDILGILYEKLGIIEVFENKHDIEARKAISEKKILLNQGNIQISIGASSNNAHYLTQLASGSLSFGGTMDSISILIEGIAVLDHDKALEILERIANSILFQIDSVTDIPLLLSRTSIEDIRKTALQNEKVLKPQLSFPEHQFTTRAITLYWYASSAIATPLLQYLAYYQVLEFFFPIFQREAMHSIIKDMLKDPSFKSTLDENISKMISRIKPHLKSDFGGNELDGLKVTLKNCISLADLIEFLEENEHRKKFLRNPDYCKDKTINIDGNQQIMSDIANRIYAIRNRIVHTKLIDDKGLTEPLIPYSKEIKGIHYDIDLIRFIARKVLIKTSEPLSGRTPLDGG